MPFPWEHQADEGVTIVLVRHGRTAWNVERRFLGSSDIPLDEVGLQEAAALSHVGWTFHRVYASPLSRAQATARHLHPDPHVVPGLVEQSQGELEGLLGPAAIVRYPSFFAAFASDPTDAAIPGGETLGACRDRSLRTLDTIADHHVPGEIVAAVTHQMVIASVACAIRGEPLAQWRTHGVRNGAATALRRLPTGWTVLVENWRFDDPPRPVGRAV